MEEDRQRSMEPAGPAEQTGDTFVEKAQALSEAQWKKYCRIFGGLLGIAGGIGLCVVPDMATFGSYKFIAVALAMLLLPRYVENQAQRDVSPGRIAMIIAFAAVLGATTVYWLVIGRL